jgi:hypothetical protein
MTPALWMSTSSRSWVARNWWAKADRIEIFQIGQALADGRAAGGDAASGRLRPAAVPGQEVVAAPRRTSATAAAYPIPEVAPVMTMVRRWRRGGHRR